MSIENEYQISSMFHEHDVCVNCVTRPKNPYVPMGKQVHGIECHKSDVEFVASQLNRLGIEYHVRSGRFMNTKHCWTHKSFKLLEIPNHEKAYEKLVAGGIA